MSIRAQKRPREWAPKEQTRTLHGLSGFKLVADSEREGKLHQFADLKNIQILTQHNFRTANFLKNNDNNRTARSPQGPLTKAITRCGNITILLDFGFICSSQPPIQVTLLYCCIILHIVCCFSIYIPFTYLSVQTWNRQIHPLCRTMLDYSSAKVDACYNLSSSQCSIVPQIRREKY